MPEFVNDCGGCVYLGSGSYEGKPHDWYRCGTGERWTLLARFGNEAHEYRSGVFLSCVEVTPLEIRALAMGLELTMDEVVKLARRLLFEKRSRAKMRDYNNYFPEDGEEHALGSANWVESP